MNRPAGDLATALLDATFGRGLVAGQGLPEELRRRFDKLVADQPTELRLARVILASRLIYLSAIDHDWVKGRLLPHFAWQSSEDEAVALWRGYAWHGRISSVLWAALRDDFFNCFSERYLARLGQSAETLAGLLMAVGVELPEADVPSGPSRAAIRSMTPDTRRAAVSWLHRHVEGPNVESLSPEAAQEQGDHAGRLWRDRVAPWIRRVWPKDAHLIEVGASQSFALLAIATADAFDSAVEMLLPYIQPIDDWTYPISRLLEMEHPQKRPRSTLRLVRKILAPQTRYIPKELRTVLEQVGASDPTLQQDSAYKSLDASLRAHGR